MYFDLVSFLLAIYQNKGEELKTMAMTIRTHINSTVDPMTFNDEDDEYLSTESNGDIKDLSDDIIDEDDEELADGLYFSLPDICLPDFDYQLTEPLCPLISDHYFLRYYSIDPPPVSGLVLIPKHTPNTQERQLEFVSLEQTQNKVRDLSFLDSLNLQILQSCNGLFLCFSQSSNLYYICNPATQHSEVLPSSTFPTDHEAVNLAFDPYTSPYYKIIIIQKLKSQTPLHQICIYSSETAQTWSVPGKPFIAPGYIDFRDAVFCNGAIHWMKRTKKGLYFNVEEELLREMPMPPLNEGYPLISCEFLGESQGRLYSAVASPGISSLELYEMKEDYSGWFSRNVIDLKALATRFPVIGRRSENPSSFLPRYECDVLSVVQRHEDDDLEVILSIPGEVIAYNLDKGSAKKVCDLMLGPKDRTVWYRVYSSFQVL